MFRKTKIRLVSLYTLVFFFILSILGASLYLFMYHTSYSSIDEKLSEKEQILLQYEKIEIHAEKERESERKVAYLFWSKNGELLKSFPQNAFFQNDISYLSPNKHTNKWETQTIAGHSYRILTIKAPTVILGYENNEPIEMIQLTYNIDPEVNILNRLLILISFGSVGGLILSFFVGLFLAKKALVPIQSSWEKQTQFVADASHELRTPLSVIQTHLELLFRHPTNTIEQESVSIFNSLTEVKRVNKLVEDLLTLARSDSNEQVLNSTWFSMDELLQLIVEQFEPIANMKEILMDERIENNLQFLGDKDRLHQLFIILIDNALKYTSPAGKVKIGCTKEGNMLKILIEDTGVGIPEEDLPYVFNRFYRSDKGRTRTEGGTGLGLSIAKWIVEAHHGQINVESKLHKGTRFSIKLPIK